MTTTTTERPVLALLRPESGPSLLRMLVTERHWNYSAFASRFGTAAREVAEADSEPRMGKVRVAERTFMNWMSGKLKGLPSPDACRVLERMFGYPVEALFGPASKRPAPPEPAERAETGQPDQAAPVAGLQQLLSASGVGADAETLTVASRLAQMLTVAFLAGAEYAGGSRQLREVG